VRLDAGGSSVPHDLGLGLDNVPELDDAALNFLNADSDWTENLVCAPGESTLHQRTPRACAHSPG
jgi:hypothetical protein